MLKEVWLKMNNETRGLVIQLLKFEGEHLAKKNDSDESWYASGDEEHVV